MVGQNETAAVTAAGIMAVSPVIASVFGQYALIMVAAVAGAFVSASRIQFASRGATVAYILRAVAITTFSAGAAAQFISSQWFTDKTGLQFTHGWPLLALVSFWIAVVGDGWLKLKDWALERWINARHR